MADACWDLVVVGGGAAGFYAAIRCGEATEGRASIVILERSSRVLQKVRISGGGRCNVTHDHTVDRKWLATNYPRGNKELIGPFHKHGPHEVVQWFADHGVELKTEADGRMFPVTDDSQTVIDCLREAARELGIEVQTRRSVEALSRAAHFELSCSDGATYQAHQVLLATGGTRSGPGAALAAMAGHSLKPAVPSLFTFEIEDPRLTQLQGVSLDHVATRVVDTKLQSGGPIVVTHWGLSGPAILKLSAWGARELEALGYEFTLEVDWLPQLNVDQELRDLRHDWAKRQVSSRSPFDAMPRRLWRRLVHAADIPSTTNWADCSDSRLQNLRDQLVASRFAVTGQSVNKDEFVTCGGVPTDEVDMRTMESRVCDGLFFAGEVLDIDGVTGGFNFQSAWTTGYLAAQSAAAGIVC